MSDIVRVKLWGTIIGSLGYAPGQSRFATFAYDPDFLASGIQVSPIHVAYPPNRFSFDQESYTAFSGLPGFIADSLPDKYGNQLIDIYMSKKGIPASRVTPLDRLNYVADRGMGALAYIPGESLPLKRTTLDVQHLAELAELVLQRKQDLQKRLEVENDRDSALAMIRIGSSAGGARSKALVARSSKGNFLDGTVSHGPDYTYWLLKFDSENNQDKDGKDPQGLPALEYIYSLLAKQAGIDVPNTELIDDGKARHFLIERFDRFVNNGKLDKLHYVSWAGLAHADRDAMNSYEQLILVIRQLNLGQAAETEIFRRAVFNVLGRNQDDHTKNTGFLMDRFGTWRLSPAFDLTYSYDPYGSFTKNHQCWLNQKNNDFAYNDLLEFGRYCNLSGKQSKEIILQVGEAFARFPELAREWDLPKRLTDIVASNLRLQIL